MQLELKDKLITHYVALVVKMVEGLETRPALIAFEVEAIEIAIMNREMQELSALGIGTYQHIEEGLLIKLDGGTLLMLTHHRKTRN